MVPPNRADEARPPRRYRFGLRWLLAVVLIFAVASAWFGRESQRVRREMQLSGELAQLGVRITGREPTGLDLAAHKILGKNRGWLRERLHVSWLGLPREVTTWTATDEQLPAIAQRIKQLRTVRELHVVDAPISDSGLARLKSDLPQVAVLTRADLAANSQPPQAQLAAAALEFVAISALTVLAVAIVVLWPFLAGLARFRLRRKARDEPA